MRTKPTTTASATPEKVRGEYKGAKWNKAREKAQAMANNTGAIFYAFPEYNGTIAIEIDYPKSGVYFETFKPDKRTIPAEKPTDLPEINWVAIAESNADALEEIERTLHVTLCKLDKAQAHADKLAEVARQAAEFARYVIEDNAEPSLEECVTLRDSAQAALAAYESEVRQ